VKARQRRFALRLAVPLVLLAIWWFASRGSTSVFFPPLSDILRRFQEIWLFDRFGTDVVPSLVRMLGGFVLGGVVGVAAGVLLGLMPVLRRATNPALQFARSIPGPALALVFLVVLGTSSADKIVLIAFVGFFPVVLNTMSGVSDMEPVLGDVAKSYRMTTSQLIRHVILPGAAPKIAAGLRISLGLSFIMMILSEYVGGTNGIGHFTRGAATKFDITDMWSGMLLLGVIGVLANVVFQVAERQVLKWQHGQNQDA